MNKKIGFIGLGNMGRPMAKRLIDAGFELLAYDIDQEALRAALDLGAHRASSLSDVATACDRILLSLPASPEVERVTVGGGGIIEAAEAGTVVIDTTTAHPLSTRKVAEALGRKNIEMLDAPVSGGPVGCEAGSLSMMVGGNKEIFEQCRPVLSAIAPKNLNYIGGIGTGHVMKLANNIVSMANRWAVGEGTVLATKAGLSPKKALEVISVSSGRSYHTAVGFPAYILTGKIDQGFTIGLACKDIDLAVELARDLGVPFFVGNKTQELYHNVLAMCGPEQDVNKIVTQMEDRVGVEARAETNT